MADIREIVLPCLSAPEYERDSDSFFLRRLACRTNDRSYNSTYSSLVTVDYQYNISLLCSKTADEACMCMHGHAAYYVTMCKCTCTFLWLLHNIL